MADGQTLIYSGSGRGTKAVKLEKKGDELVAKELWHNTENSVQFNTPVVKDGLVFGLTPRTACSASAKTARRPGPPRSAAAAGTDQSWMSDPCSLALTPASELIVFEASDKGYKDLATYKVSATETYAYPVVTGNRRVYQGPGLGDALHD